MAFRGRRRAGSRSFSLLCGYSMGSFYKDTAFEEICGQHTHVVSEHGIAPASRPRQAS